MARSATLEPTARFDASLAELTDQRAKSALKAMRMFVADTHHGKLNFEKLTGLPPYCSIRTGSGGDRILLKRIQGGHYLLIEVGSHDYIYRVAKTLPR